MKILFILALLPSLHLCQFDWKVEQPVSYVIYNGKYYPNPTENIKPLEEDTSTSSFLEGLNPLNVFSTIWNSLPSLNIFGSSDHVDEESDFTDAGAEGEGGEIGINEYQKSHHGTKYPLVSTVQNGLFAGSPTPVKADLPFDLASFPAHSANPFYYNVKRRRRRRSLGYNPIPHPRFQNEQQQSLVFYKPLGQGNYMKYDILPERDYLDEVGKERRRPGPGPLKKPLTPYYRFRTLRNKLKRRFHESANYLNTITDETTTTKATAAAAETTTTASSSTTKDASADPCPKFGVWNFDGEMCVSIGPIPRWACRPKDLLTSGRLVVCRNKVFFP